MADQEPVARTLEQMLREFRLVCGEVRDLEREAIAKYRAFANARDAKQNARQRMIKLREEIDERLTELENQE